MRKLTEPEAHRARAAVVDGNYPDGMSARCGWCRQVGPVTNGEFVSAAVIGSGPSKIFRCSSCADGEAGAA